VNRTAYDESTAWCCVPLCLKPLRQFTYSTHYVLFLFARTWLSANARFYKVFFYYVLKWLAKLFNIHHCALCWWYVPLFI